MYYIGPCAKFLTWLLSLIFKIPGTVPLKEGIIILNIQMKKLRFTEVKQFSQDHPVRTPDNLSLEYPLFTITVLALSKEWDCPSSKLLNRSCNLLIGTHLCLVRFSSCVWLCTFKFLEGVLVPGDMQSWESGGPHWHDWCHFKGWNICTAVGYYYCPQTLQAPHSWTSCD